MNQDKPIRIYQCADTMDGILSAVYEAGISGYGHRYIRIRPKMTEQAENLELFSEYIWVESSHEKAQKVLSTIQEKICQRAYYYVMNALVCAFEDKADTIYQFLTYGFTMGSKVVDALQISSVKRIFEITRNVGNETHFFKEFLRFQEVQKEPSLLLATIEPTHHIIPMLTEHFVDRFAQESFIIYDKTHHEAAIHPANSAWEVRLLTTEEAQNLERLTEQGNDYVALWKTFFKHIVIDERINKKLQTNMLPIHYRKHMTEFIDTPSSR